MIDERAKARPWLLRCAIRVHHDDFPPFAERVIPFPPNWVLVFALVNSSLFSLHLRYLPPIIAYVALAAPFLIFAGYIVVNGVRARRLARHARRAGFLLCTNCAYDMRNSIGQWKCPECGYPWEHEDAMQRWSVFVDGRFSSSEHHRLDRRKRLIEAQREEKRRR